MSDRILYVDDEPALVFLITRELAKLGIAAQGFASAQEALAAFGREPQAVSLVLTELTMPGGMSGLELAQAVLAIRPDTADRERLHRRRGDAARGRGGGTHGAPEAR